MVAHMTAFGSSADNFKDGNGDVLLQDEKADALTANVTNASDSTEDSTEEEDSANESSTENNDTENESDPSSSSQEPDPPPKPETEKHDGGALPKTSCSKCEAIQNEGYNSVTPRNISRGRYLLLLEDEGTYQCSITGLVFEVSQKVQIQYSILSWTKYGMFLKDSWKLAGPIFDVDCDPSILKSIHFPHSLCLADPTSELTFGILHIKNRRPIFEPSTDHSGSHIKWTVTSLSPVGTVVKTSQPTEHHGVVLVYKEVAKRPSCSFRIYLATNNQSDINDIKKVVQRSNKKYVKIEKPPTCQRLLQDGKTYRLTSEPEAEIGPKELQFSQEVVMLKGYFEVFFEQSPPFELSLIEVDSEQTVWTAKLREGDCEDNATEKPRKSSQKRKRSRSTSDEDLSNKKSKGKDMADITDQQLMMVARKMGKEWQQVAILHLDLKLQDLEKLPDEDLTMRKFKMLDLWRRKVKGGASAPLLYEALNKEDVPNEVRDVLEEIIAS
ncbi:NACHT, LRR and PYD domains-containing protein 1 isoform X3 [Brienomyrus brachyistius]|uniref:NACHT, LRR and PYD domains-containing protein 1 isoform X3 n=1 Tax=Brienomyrus brachyistius TaxID=42636 RepID=UPI0020B41264|nr:NACHT, LRR and PYD domains-containing protein 1 isoform X3 [Brienomyrus brachyistius]